MLVGAAVVVALSASGLAASVDASVASKNTKAEKSLLKHVPSATASGCKGKTASVKSDFDVFTEVKAPVKRIVAAVECSTGALPPNTNAAQLTYIQFANAGDMTAVYNAVVSSGLQVQPGTAAPAPNTCPQEGTYSPQGGGTTTGHVACAPSTADGMTPGNIIWTNDALKIMARGIVDTDADGSALVKFFLSPDSGPRA